MTLDPEHSATEKKPRAGTAGQPDGYALEPKKDAPLPKVATDADNRQGIDPAELAMIAATLDPEGCKDGNGLSALVHAAALLRLSAHLCDQLNHLDDRRLTYLCDDMGIDGRALINLLDALA